MVYSRITWRWLFAGLLAAVGLYFLYRVRAVFPPFIFAIALTYLLNPVVNSFSRRMSRTQAIMVVYAAVAAVAVLAVMYGIPTLAREFAVFTESIPRYTETVQSIINNYYLRYRSLPLPDNVRQILDENISNGERLVLDTLRSATQIALGLVSQVVSLIVAPVLAFYFLHDKGGLTSRISEWFPSAFREELLSLLAEIDSVLHNFVMGRVFVAIIVGALTSVGLAVIGMDTALVLGVIAGIFDLIPYFGPVFGALPAVLLAGMISTKQVLAVIVVFAVVQQVEANVLAPLILGETMGLHPVLVIFALLAGGYLYGVWGALLAVPVAAILGILVRHICRRVFQEN